MISKNKPSDRENPLSDGFSLFNDAAAAERESFASALFAPENG